MPKYHDEFDPDDSASERSSVRGDEESGEAAALPPNGNRGISVSRPLPLEPPFPNSKTRSSATMTTYAANDGGEDFTDVGIDDQHPYKPERSMLTRLILIAAIVLLTAAAIGALAAVLGGGDTDGKAASSTSNGNTVSKPTPPASAPAPKPTTVVAKTPTASPVVTSPPTSETYSFIKSRMPDGGLTLMLESSYQSVAMEYVVSTYDPSIHTPERVIQRFVLACIILATNKQDNAWTQLPGNAFPFPWQQSSGWLQDPSECNWYGITCNDQGLVSEIDLSNNWLTGEFPPETSMLADSLKLLAIAGALSYNYGDELDWIGDLTLLEDLDISNTVFQYDGIPSSFGKLTNLRSMDISYTLMHGKLRGEVFDNMQLLNFLYIGGNSYNSSLPSSIAALSSLNYFYADTCDLEGDLSMWKTPNQTPSLKELWIYYNPKVSGEIPVELGTYSNLESLALSNMNLTGPIPSQIGNLPAMKQMWLNTNKLTGMIPSELGSLSNLRLLEVYDNDLTGEMPTALCARVATSQINYMWADCTVSSAGAFEVNCSSSCCACCGTTCAAASTKSNGGRTLKAKTTTTKTSPEEARRQLRHQERRQRHLKLNQDPVLAKANAARRKTRMLQAQTLAAARRRLPKTTN